MEDSSVLALAPTFASPLGVVGQRGGRGPQSPLQATTVGANAVRRAGTGFESIVGISARTVTSCHELAVVATISNPALSASIPD